MENTEDMISKPFSPTEAQTSCDRGEHYYKIIDKGSLILFACQSCSKLVGRRLTDCIELVSPAGLKSVDLEGIVVTPPRYEKPGTVNYE